MDELRASTPDERLALKASVKRALKMSGGAASFQHVTRIGESDLSKCALPVYSDRHLPIDVALELDREAGAPVIIAALAAALGYRLILAEGICETPLGARDLSTVSSNAASLNAELADALEDGAIDAGEEHKIVTVLERSIADMRRIQKRVKAAARKVIS